MRLHILAALLLLLAPPLAAQAQDAPPEAFLADGAEGFADGEHLIVLVRRLPPEDAQATGEALADRHGAELSAIWPLVTLEETCFVLRLPPAADPDAVRAEVEAEELVLLAYPIQPFELSAETAEPLIPVQDALRAMKLDRIGGTGAGVRVALVDTGVAFDHPDLASRDVVFRDFVRPGPVGPVPERHGTAMAALIAADARNGAGMAGIAPDATILALRACWEDEAGAGRCNTFSLAIALDYAVQAGTDVLNLSLGGPSDKVLEAITGRAVEGGTLVVAADGAAPFPSAVPGVLRVAPPGEGGAAVLHAPGLEVLSAKPADGYDFFTGASVAAAHVSGVAARLWSLRPEAGAARIRAALTATPDLDACLALGRLEGTEGDCG